MVVSVRPCLGGPATDGPPFDMGHILWCLALPGPMTSGQGGERRRESANCASGRRGCRQSGSRSTRFPSAMRLYTAAPTATDARVRAAVAAAVAQMLSSLGNGDS